jgi:hypothetical protein
MRINAERVKEAPAHALRAVFAGIGQLLLAADKAMRKRGADPEGPTSGAEPAAQAATPAAETGNPATGADSSAAGAGRPAAGAGQPAAGAGQPPATAAGSAAAPARPPAGSASRSLDRTGNVRLLTAEDRPGESPDPPAAATTWPAAEPEPEPEAEPTAEPEPAAAAEPTAEPEPTAAAEFDASASSAESAADLPEAELPGVTQPEAEVSPAEIPEASATEAAAPDATGSAGALAEADLPVPNYDSLSLPSLRARLRGLDAAQVGVLVAYERSQAGRADVVAMFERRIAKLAAGE